MIAGLDHVRVLPTTQGRDFALDPETLAAAMAADVEAGLLPFFVSATIGTTSSCAVDPVPELADVATRSEVYKNIVLLENIPYNALSLRVEEARTEATVTPIRLLSDFHYLLPQARGLDSCRRSACRECCNMP